MAADEAVSASARGATFLILLQMGSRAITFALNQFLLRFLSPELLGVSVQLELFVISTLYFARESLRIAAQRRSDGGVQAAINISYLAILAGGPIGFTLAQAYLRTETPNAAYLHVSMKICHFAAMLELLSEPSFAAVQQNMLYKTRASAEGAAVLMKTFATAGLVFWSRHRSIDVGVLPFAAGEFAYGATLAVVYILSVQPVAREKGFSLLPREMSGRCVVLPSNVGVHPVDRLYRSGIQYYLGLFSQPLLSLSFSLYLQTGIKYVLTEGDKYLIAALATLKDTGMYALSANYGGLIARMLFRPIEDSSRNLFAKLCSDAGEARQVGGITKKTEPKQNSENVQQAANVLRDILRVYGLVSLVAYAVGPSAAPLLLRLVAGARWSDTGAGDVLGTYCYYIPLLAVNGISEAFVSATASTSELRKQSIWMGGFSVAFAGSAYLFLSVLQMGAKGLVLANCVNMISRIVFNLSFVKRYFEERNVVSIHRDSRSPIPANQIAGLPIHRHRAKPLRNRGHSGGAGCAQPDTRSSSTVWLVRRLNTRCQRWSSICGFRVRSIRRNEWLYPY
jgi:oligosaccharide translocation protein RFT1